MVCAGCVEPTDPGMCRGYFPRSWFNPQSKTCEEFIYGGCGGNANNYITQEVCAAACFTAE